MSSFATPGLFAGVLVLAACAQQPQAPPPTLPQPSGRPLPQLCMKIVNARWRFVGMRAEASRLQALS